MAHTIIEKCTGCTACLKICPVAAIHGERKQLHSIDPALCIDCGACGRICPVEAVHDPLGQVMAFVKRTRWHKPVVTVSKCISCMVCLQDCPVNCLGWGAADKESHRVSPVLGAPTLCIACEFCARGCPVEAIEMRPPVLQE